MEVFQFIRAFVAENPWPPTLREIADGVGLSGPSSVSRHLERLAAWELIERRRGSPRGIVLTGKGERLSSAFGTLAEKKPD
ncbi:MAG: MarR family transcriptional regulator [Anaerolineae bacterium]|nr:MarR family transcriptional regulator [Anaerolineae bacterium]